MKKLKTILDIDESQPLEKRLNALRHWCLDHISHDLVYEGHDLVCYEQYLNLAKRFLERFLSRLPKDLTLAVYDFSNMNPIQYAAYKGYDSFLSKIRKILIPERLNKATPTGMTPLHLAAVSGHIHTVKLLVSLKAKLSIRNKSQETPLHSLTAYQL